MFQFESLFSDPAMLRYLIGGIIVLVIIIVCYSIHNKLMKA
ncbi:hypothetical protein LCGC14_1086730 [marine sediment metagenome]|uniref:Uncharacterized protein n=1 Tax=marine sediment metagenome TaxID=412755 RepID=A0A0F9PWT0_9ZZZZ